MRLVIVGHGPSALGHDPDQYDLVVRLKYAHFFVGTRLDAYVGTSMMYWKGPQEKAEFWLFNHKPNGRVRNIDYERWMKYFSQFNPTYKPSCGLCAVFGASEFYPDAEITLLGFDSWGGNPNTYLDSNRQTFIHDAGAEQRCAESLGATWLSTPTKT